MATSYKIAFATVLCGPLKPDLNFKTTITLRRDLEAPTKKNLIAFTFTMRRTTLGPVSSSQLNTRSSVLHHPSTRVSVPNKSTAAMERQSIGAMSRRVSTARRPPTGARASVNPRQSVGTNRRNSTYSSRASVSGRGGGRVLDPRPVGDRSFLNSCVATLVEYLSDHMYDQTLSPTLLRRGPSKKDFSNMILFLFKQVDPTFTFGVKFEEDVVLQFRNLRYPIPISKTSLAAVGTPHTWPTLLLSISWLIELLSYDEVIQANDAEQNDENDDENGDKPFFKYLDASYHAFLAGDDDKFEILASQEREKLISRNEAVKQEATTLEQKREELKRRIEKAKRDKNALLELNERKQECLGDLDKFHKMIAKYETNIPRLDKKMQTYAETLQTYEEELAIHKEEIERLETRIKNQELSAYDIEQIAQQRARLTEQLRQVQADQDVLQKRIKNDENRAAQIRDSVRNAKLAEKLLFLTFVCYFGQLDVQIHEYTTTCKQMKIIPVTAKNSLGFDFMLELDPALHELDGVQHLAHHLKNDVRQAQHALKQNRITRANAGLDEALVLDEELRQHERNLDLEIELEKRWEADVEKFAEQMRIEREKREDSLRRKTAAIKEVEATITKIANADNLTEEESNSLQHLSDVKKEEKELNAAYRALLDKNRHAVANVLVACTDYKAMIDRAITSLEDEVGKAEL
ncbi:Kinetochore protein NDC80 [Phytophthora citrophthora]|uniref:Kinetochore protein NDC80 n=1 Tax=Phytophthora citrophthora TaxID=4793 RepID=A0AAD9LK17_9STRA|nr:Kinetochore protein NDC80 [Phytophthora citrophthora]